MNEPRKAAERWASEHPMQARNVPVHVLEHALVGAEPIDEDVAMIACRIAARDFRTMAHARSNSCES